MVLIFLFHFEIFQEKFPKQKCAALAGLSTSLQTKRSSVQFPVRNMPGLEAKSLVGGVREATI